MLNNPDELGRHDVLVEERKEFLNTHTQRYYCTLHIAHCTLQLCFLVVSLHSTCYPQADLLPLEHQLNHRLGSAYFPASKDFHSSIQPYELRDFQKNGNVDSLLFVGRVFDPSDSSWLERKLFNEHLLEAKGTDYRISLDFIPDFCVGYDAETKQTTWLNTRGFMADGYIGNSIAFHTEFYEDQAKFPGYLDNFIKSNFVIPGQGYRRIYRRNPYDYGYASGVLSYSSSQYFNFQFGHGKNFFGNGYRSMLLSDVSFNYPYLKVSTNIWRIKYVNLWAQFQDVGRISHPFDTTFVKKYGAFQYLDLNVTDRLSVGFFEAIIWRDYDSTRYRGFDLNYLNPIIFLRPVEFSVGSPDNALMGLNASYKVTDHVMVYGQFLLDEMTISEYFKNRGYWANKYGVQLGAKSFEPYDVQRLYLQTEVNLATPYTYSHFNPVSNYGHYNQSLAHPLGANFYEGLGIAEYSLGRLEFRAQCNYAVYGADSSANSNVGRNIFLAYSTHPKEFGNFIGQGVRTTLFYANFQTAYVLNPLTNLRFELAATYRSLSSDLSSNQVFLISFGLRASFRNLYYDF